MKLWGIVLSFLSSVTLWAQVVQFQSGGTASASLSSIPEKVVADNGPASLKIDFNLPGLDLNPAADGFSNVLAKNLYPLDIAGSPDVGVTGSLFVVPPGYEPSLRILAQETKTLQNTLLAPAQHKVRCNCDDNNSFHFNSALYKSGSYFPSSVATLETVGNFQNVRFGRVRIQPIQQNFENESVLVTTRLSLEITFVASPDARLEKSNLSPLAERIAKNLAPNAFDVIEGGSESTALETMVIFTHDSYTETLRPFIEWKRLRGIEVKLYTLSQLGGSKEKAKEFLQKLYNESAIKPSYLLIVGDKVTFPTFEERTTTGLGIQMAITDYPFSLLSGDDAVPDLLYGRLLVSNSEELAIQISKIIGFERNPEQNDWYTRGTTIASNEGEEPSDKEYALQIQGSLKKFTFREMDSFFQGDMTAKEVDILSAVNTGRSWLTYIGHGSGTSWGSVNDKFDLQSIGKLSNSRHPILVDVACENANYRQFDVPMGKAWMNQTNAGKPVGTSGYYGGSVSISWHPPAIMATGIAKTHFEKPAYSFGASVLAGQLFLIEQKGTNEQTIDNLRWYNLFGDPSMLLRTDTPKALLVERGKTTKRGDIEIRVSSNGNPVEGAVASVLRSNGQISSVKTRSDGTAILPSAKRLVVTGYNLETNETPLE